MKIGIDASCLETHRGGVARILTNLLLHWPKLNDHHRFVLYFERQIPQDEFLQQPQMECKLIKGGHLKRKVLSQQVFLPLQLRTDKIDMFFAPWYYAPILCPSPKTVVGAWDISFKTHREHYTFRERAHFSLFSRISCSRASGLFTCSVFDARQIQKYYGIPPERICILRLAADDRFKLLSDPARIRLLRRKYNLPEQYILSLGRIFNRRNVDVIIDGFKEVYRDYPDIGLVVVGRNSTVPYIDIEKKMDSLVEEGRGLYLPWIPENDLADIYSGAWYYICTSTVDGETIMLKEAMQCGTPVVTSPLLEESIEGNGIVLPDPTSREETAELLRRIIPCQKLRREYSAKGLKWVKQLSWAQVAKQSLEFLESS